MGKSDFWENLEFNNEEVKLGAYKDIVSADSPQNAFFRVGVIEWKEESKSLNIPNIFLFEFCEKNSLPVIQKYYCLQF